MFRGRADVLIIVESPDALSAAKDAATPGPHGGPGVTRWVERDPGTSAPYWWGEFDDGIGPSVVDRAGPAHGHDRTVDRIGDRPTGRTAEAALPGDVRRVRRQPPGHRPG